MKYKPLIIGTVIYYLLISFVFATFNLVELPQKDRGIIAICYMWVTITYCILKWLLEQDKE